MTKPSPATIAAKTQHSSDTRAEEIKEHVGECLSQIPTDGTTARTVEELDETLELLRAGHDVLVEALDNVDDITNS